MQRLLSRCVLFFLIVLLSCGLLGAQEIAGRSAPEFFPLHKGNFWVYEGTTSWTSVGQPQVQQKKMLWKMEVVDVVARGKWVGALLKGHPFDLTWYEEGRQPGDYLIVCEDERKYYFLEGPRVNEVWSRFHDLRDNLAQLLTDDEFFFQSPLAVPQGYDVKRIPGNGEYAWVVEDEKELQWQDIQGPRFSPPPKQYRLVFRTLPDHTFVDFVPGVGIVRFIYSHHGTVAETDLRLIRFSAS